MSGADSRAGSTDDRHDVCLDFAIDRAVSKARTAAFFSSGDPTNVDGHSPLGTVGPLTTRTVRFISQSTVTQREVESNPNIPDLDSSLRGPGFVAPIGLGGHFPPEVRHTPPVDLFAIEHTNRDRIPGDTSVLTPNANLINNFNGTFIVPNFVPQQNVRTVGGATVNTNQDPGDPPAADDGKFGA